MLDSQNKVRSVRILISLLNQRYLSAVPPTGRLWLNAFLRWVRAQGFSPDTPGIPKNASGPVGIPRKGAFQTPGDKTNPSEEG